jgi:hypothetical protein
MGSLREIGGGLGNPKSVAVVSGVIGVLVIAIGLLVAPILSCAEESGGYGLPIFRCPDGVHSYSNIYPYSDMLMPWLRGGILLLVMALYNYTKWKAATR